MSSFAELFALQRAGKLPTVATTVAPKPKAGAGTKMLPMAETATAETKKQRSTKEERKKAEKAEARAGLTLFLEEDRSKKEIREWIVARIKLLTED